MDIWIQRFWMYSKQKSKTEFIVSSISIIGFKPVQFALASLILWVWYMT